MQNYNPSERGTTSNNTLVQLRLLLLSVAAASPQRGDVHL